MIKADESEKKNKSLVKLDGLEGLWYEQPDMLSKYKRRPDELEDIRSVHFAKMMKSGGKAKLDKHTEHEGPDEEEYQNDLESEEGASTNEEDPNEKL